MHVRCETRKKLFLVFVSQCVTLRLFCLSFNTGHNKIIYSQTKLLPTDCVAIELYLLFFFAFKSLTLYSFQVDNDDVN